MKSCILWCIFMIISMGLFIYYVCDFKNSGDMNKKQKKENKEKFQNFNQEGEIELKDGYYVIRGSRNNLYCSDSPNGMICNIDLAGPHETFIIQKLNNGEYAIQSTKTNLWCSQTTTGMRCLSPVIRDSEIFKIKKVIDNKYAIQNVKNGLYCVDNGEGLSCETSLLYKDNYDLFEFHKVPNPNYP